jgi:hypothetical protein
MIGLLTITGLAFALVSAAASVILWCSYATTTTDSAIAAITAVASVACMYLFAAASKSQALKPATSNGMRNLTGILLISSIAATVGWLESRYQAQHTNSLTTDYSYTTKQQQIADLTTDIQNLQQSARADIANNYRARANRTQIKIDNKTEQRDQLSRELNQHKGTATNAGQALGNSLGHLRWVLWLALAIIVDACPIICFSAVAQLLQQQPATDNNTAKQPTTEQPEPAAARAATPETAAINTSDISDLLPATDWLQEQILNHGQKPSIRNFLGQEYDGTKLRHEHLKHIFHELELRQVIKRKGQGFELVGALA